MPLVLLWISLYADLRRILSAWVKPPIPWLRVFVEGVVIVGSIQHWHIPQLLDEVNE